LLRHEFADGDSIAAVPLRGRQEFSVMMSARWRTEMRA